MSTQPNVADGAAQSAEIHSFAELACFDQHDQQRPARAEVVFRLFSVGKGLGVKLDLELRSDYYVYYDGDDEYLLNALAAAVPAVPWHHYVFHRWLDQSRVHVLHPDSGKIVAQLETRRYFGRKVNLERVERGEYGANVVSLRSLRLAENDQ